MMYVRGVCGAERLRVTAVHLCLYIKMKGCRKLAKSYRYKLVIFDMDGTILDTLADLYAAINHSLAHFGLPQRSLPEVRSFLGNGSRRLVELSVPQDTNKARAALIEELLNYYSAYYKAHCAEKTQPYDGITSLLAELRGSGVLTAVVSNKPDFGVQKLCAEYFAGLFDFYCGEREGIRRKPAPDSVLEALYRLNVRPQDAVYIGDSEVDVATAVNAGLDCIAVSWGFRDMPVLQAAGARTIVSSVENLKAKLLAE